MMKNFKLGILTILITGIIITIAGAADDGWKKIGESEGIVGYTRPTTRSSVDEIKAVGIVDAPIAVVEAVIRDISVMPEYIFLCKEAVLINTSEMRSGGDVMYFYSVTDLPFPVSDRDVVNKVIWSIDKATGAIYCHAEGVKTTYKQNKNIVRMPLSITDCTLVSKGADKTQYAGERRARIADIAEPVVVLVRLVGVGLLGAVVLQVRDAVAIVIGERIAVEREGAVVRHVRVAAGVDPGSARQLAGRAGRARHAALAGRTDRRGWVTRRPRLRRRRIAAHQGERDRGPEQPHQDESTPGAGAEADYCALAMWKWNG